MEGMEYFVIFALIITFLIAKAYFNSPEAKGKRGEKDIESSLSWISLLGKPGKILTNLYVPTGNGHTTEIDVLFITVKGIFVIESKNYAGYIFGNENNRNWTVTLYGGKNFLGFKKVDKYHFYNPIWQNRTHIRVLQSYIGQSVKYFSIIVFADRGELKKITVDSADTTVCNRRGLSGAIGNYWRQLPDTLTDTQVDRLYDKLLPLTDVSEEEKTAHVRQVAANSHRTYQKGQKTAPGSDLKCPWCGGTLVVRTAKHGPNAGSQFYGCSNFPNCRFTKNRK